MKARILFPIALALLLAGSFVAFLWWQVASSTSLLDIEAFLTKRDAVQTTVIDLPTDPRDLSLVHLRQGDLYSLRGEWKKAQEEFEKAVNADGGLPALRKLIQAQLQRRDIRGVKSTLRAMQQAGARPEDILLIESLVELRAGELLAAETILENASDAPQKEYGLALLSMVQGNHEKAQSHLHAVINGWEPILRSYARTLQAAYDEFLLFPEGSNMHLITLLSRALAQVHECELALPLLTQVTNINASYRDAWIVQGYCELITERADQALLSLEQAYNIDPQKPEIQYFLARAYRSLGQDANAVTFLEYSLVNGFEPQEEVRLLLAEVALTSGNTELALSQYDALTELDSARLETFEGFVAASIAAGNTEAAFAKAVLATEKFADNPRAFELLGKTAEEAGHIDDALRAYEEVLKVQPDNEEVKKKIEELTE